MRPLVAVLLGLIALTVLAYVYGGAFETAWYAAVAVTCVGWMGLYMAGVMKWTRRP